MLTIPYGSYTVTHISETGIVSNSIIV